MAAGQGAKVFMVSRSEADLQKLQDEFRTFRFETAYAVADVAEFDQLQVAADSCLRTFGRIDTWINNAGITIYSKLLETTEDEAKRLFDTNFWGVVNGCKVAVPIMRNRGGVIINMGSVLATTVDPHQGIYTAAEHALKGFTDALRQELKADGTPVALTLVLPGAVDTPFREHARKNEQAEEPLILSSPEEVAQVILRCAQRPVNETRVGASSVMLPLAGKLYPYLRLSQDTTVRQKTGLVAGGLATVGGALLLFKRLRIP